MKVVPLRHWREERPPEPLPTVEEPERLAVFLIGRMEDSPLSPAVRARLSVWTPGTSNSWRRDYRKVLTVGATLAVLNLAFAALWWAKHRPTPSVVATPPSAAVPARLSPVEKVGQVPPMVPRPILNSPQTVTARIGRTSPRNRVDTAIPRIALSPSSVGPKLSPHPSTAPASLPPTLPREATEIGTALQQLRRDRDPGGALASLVIYHLHFPRGGLAREAAAIEIDANLALGRRAEALVVLQGELSQPTAPPRVRELRLLRGELLAADGHCLEALADFEDVLPQSSADLRERALFGRATCRARTGDPTGSRTDLEAYLAQFPRGRFSDAVRSALAR